MNQFQLDIYFEEWPGPDDDGRQIGLQVDDKNAAQQNQYPYSSWVMDDYNGSYSYSENCTLSINTFQQENMHVYVNPVNGFLNIDIPKVKLQKIILYNVQGKK